MAAATTSNANQMERLTTCPVCLDKFRIPKVLPCMHTFCLTPCLTNLVDPRARSLRCPECRREHQIPPGGVQAFPANLTMIGFLDLQPVSNDDRADRCFSCKAQKSALVKCHECSKYFCTDCREPHLREVFYQVSSSVSQLRRTLPKLSEKIATYEQRVNAVRTNDEQIRREIVLAIGNLVEQLKHRETALFTEADVYLQSQLRTFRLQQEAAEIELASVASFCESVGTALPNGQLVHDADLASIRAQAQLYGQQIEALQAQIPNNIQKLRIVFENQEAISTAIHNFGQFIDLTRDVLSQNTASQVFQLQQQPRFSSAPYPQSSMNYANTMPSPRYVPSSAQTDQFRHLENLYYSRGAGATQSTQWYQPTPGSRPRYNPLAESPNSPFVNLSSTMPSRPMQTSYSASWTVQPTRPPVQIPHTQSASIFGPNPFASNINTQQSPRVTVTAPPPAAAAAPIHVPTTNAPPIPPPNEPTPRRNHMLSTNAARSLEGDDRPIFGGRGNRGGATAGDVTSRRKGRAAIPAPIQELEPSGNGLQRRRTFVLDEPTLPNLPQSGAQRPRDTVNVPELYNVRRRNRAQTPVAFTINLNEASQTNDVAATTDETH